MGWFPPLAIHKFITFEGSDQSTAGYLLKKITWHILGDRPIPLAPLNLVGFYM